MLGADQRKVWGFFDKRVRVRSPAAIRKKAHEHENIMKTVESSVGRCFSMLQQLSAATLREDMKRIERNTP